jgi:phosphoglycolate phosphatase-like HAD superfamily hydrolase
MPPRPLLLILDCDGVLIRSERANLAYYNHLFGLFGLPVVAADDRDRFWLLHTLSTTQVIDAFFPPSLRDRAREASASLDFSPFLPLVEGEPGWIGVLGRRRPPLKVAVATNRGQSARDVLGAVGLLPHLDFVATVRDVKRPKPHPDLLLAVLDHFGAPPEDALYVGDSELDRQASAAARVPFVGFRTASPPSVSSPEELERRLGPVARPEDSASLPAWIPKQP